VTVSILINKLTLCHKGDGEGTVTATLPDVCKTPPSTLPVPYPNVAFAIDLAGGTTTVFVDGGNMAAHKASVFATSTGDEPGTLGGVKSGVNMAEASWLSYSMDVFLEGLNACRLTDKMLLNHGNTVSMAGFLTQWLNNWLTNAKAGAPDCDALAQMINDILNGAKGDPNHKPEPIDRTSPVAGMRGLKERFYQQIYGRITPSQPGWGTHNNEIENLEENLRDFLNVFTQWCGGGTAQIPSDAWQWATKPLPTATDYKGPVTAPTSSAPGIDWGTVGKVALGVAVVGAVIAGVIFAPEITIPALFFAPAL
jgi:hypothetical protein